MGGASTRLHEYSGVCIKLLKVLDPTLTLTVPPWPRPLSSPSVSANSGPAGLAGGRYHRQLSERCHGSPELHRARFHRSAAK